MKKFAYSRNDIQCKYNAISLCWRDILFSLINFVPQPLRFMFEITKRWVSKWTKFRSNTHSIVGRGQIFIVTEIMREETWFIVWWMPWCERDGPDIQQWFKYSEARGQNVALLYITVIFFFFLSFHRRIRFSGSLRPVTQPLPLPRRFVLVLRGYYLRNIEVPIPHYDDESLKPSCSSPLSKISLKIRGAVTLIKPPAEYYYFLYLIIGPWCHKKSPVIQKFWLQKKCKSIKI